MIEWIVEKYSSYVRLLYFYYVKELLMEIEFYGDGE